MKFLEIDMGGEISLTLIVALITLDLTPETRETSQNKQSGCHQTESFCTVNNEQSEKNSLWLGENLCKPFT